MSMLITICARGGSKGVPEKNIKEVQGRPLIAYTIDHAKKFAAAHDGVVALSTDSDEIKAVAAECGLESDYERPAELATDTAGKIGVMKDVLLHEEASRGSKFEYLVDLDITSPLRTQEDLENGLKLMEEDPNALNLFSVSPAYRSPYFNMVEPHEDGYHKLSKPLDTPIHARQQAPEVYHLNASFYMFRREFFEHDHTTPFTEKSLVYVMQHTCFDLDEPVDFEFLTFLLENDKLGFAL